MDTQQCARCGLDLPLDAYAPSRRGQRGTYCRKCQAAYKKAWKEARRGLPRHLVLLPVPKPPRRPRQPSTSYQAVHKRLRAQRGKASEQTCRDCGAVARDWAYDHTDPCELTAEWCGKTVVYSADLDRYIPLCRPCHNRMDSPYEGSVLQRLNETRRQSSPAAMTPDPEPTPATAW